MNFHELFNAFCIFIVLSFFSIFSDDTFHILAIFIINFAYDFSWTSECQCVWWYDFALGNKTSSTDKSSFTDFCCIKHNRPHAD